MSQKQFLDVFVEKAAEQWKLIAGVAGAAIVLLGILALVNENHARRDREATNMLYVAQSASRKAVAEKKYEEAEKAYAPLLEKFKGTRASFEAELQMGDIWMDAGNYDKAVEHYQNGVSLASDPFSRLLGTYTIGIAKESAGKLDDAVKAYGEALNISGSDFLRPEILMAQARCYEALHQAAKAIEIYKTVQDKYATRSYYSGAASAFEKQLSGGADAKL